MWLEGLRQGLRRPPVEAPAPTADICLVVEGCYPYVPGGVSTWVDWLIKGNPDLTFAIVALVADPSPREIRYTLPANVVRFESLPLTVPLDALRWRDRAPPAVEIALADTLVALVNGGGLAALRDLVQLIRDPANHLSLGALMASQLSWRLASATYERLMPHASFLHFFWAWRALFGGLFAVVTAPLPPARVYHTISTGYAGLFAARAALETGAPTLITEHGIYTNERRVEILMAEWICDTVDKGISLQDERVDLRDIWIRTFEAHALVCYQACARILTLYEDNQRLQRALGAPQDRLAVIPNGIDLARFASVAPVGANAPPTVALIGRVVPIKDVKSFIDAVALIRRNVPGLRALVLGPTDEDPQYFEECCRRVAEHALEETLTFTGPVNIVAYMSQIHVVVLTSLSEAQPLVILEAGAAGIPTVATDVGACREMIEGRADEAPRLGPGGEVTRLVDPQQTAEAVAGLLQNEPRRRACGEAMRARVRQSYSSADALAAYARTYAAFLDGSGS
ncbi:GT4 family glycosyltransferase PelF [Methylobacterium gregans]|uniref:D-inositol-3-phosphate glycosyltransferase n=2 Tax=Methylobacterium gregans TaxID=374424 RepID=A0AA37HRP0_9HYPH|nr:GT4 family glycosyltransferase PelF [Methylobacterium gregans]MDQ0523183.1 glycosyltransferase involved in cell wall biosynthesis [Methylobacterium gregans]GJD80764.1 D-inositol-3-phosphate glycosyltransferase [Methylobacterium gregans]GLS53598.1 pellicle/biofilm biosynthesis glycosyltransferase PelF [Methylobacterium gregans]